MSGEGLLLVCYSLQFLRRMRTLPLICLAPSCFCLPPSFNAISKLSASIKIILNGIAYQRLEIITSFLYAIAFCSHPIIQQLILPDSCKHSHAHLYSLTYKRNGTQAYRRYKHTHPLIIPIIYIAAYRLSVGMSPIFQNGIIFSV